MTNNEYYTPSYIIKLARQRGRSITSMVHALVSLGCTEAAEALLEFYYNDEDDYLADGYY